MIENTPVRVQASSQDRSEYTQRTTIAETLERTADLGLARSSGQTIEYVVTDDSRSTRNRVRLTVEEPTAYDIYSDLVLLRTVTAVLAPVGWSTKRIKYSSQMFRICR